MEEQIGIKSPAIPQHGFDIMLVNVCTPLSRSLMTLSQTFQSTAYLPDIEK